MSKIDVFVFVYTMIVVGFILGWVFPVEGPIDYVYDNAVKKKVPERVAPVEKKTLNAGEVDMFIDDFGALNIRYLDDNGDEQLIDILPRGEQK